MKSRPDVWLALLLIAAIAGCRTAAPGVVRRVVRVHLRVASDPSEARLYVQEVSPERAGRGAAPDRWRYVGTTPMETVLGMELREPEGDGAAWRPWGYFVKVEKAGRGADCWVGPASIRTADGRETYYDPARGPDLFEERPGVRVLEIEQRVTLVLPERPNRPD